MKALICVDPALAELPFLDRIQKAVEIGCDAVEQWNWDCTDMDTVQATAAREGIGIACFQANRGGSLIRAEHRERGGAGVRASLVIAREMGVKSPLLAHGRARQGSGRRSRVSGIEG